MFHLHECGASVLVNRRDQLCHTGDESVLVHPVALSPSRAKGIVDGRRLDRNEADASTGERLVEPEGYAVHVELVIVEIHHAGRGLVDAVPRFYIADAAGL